MKSILKIRKAPKFLRSLVTKTKYFHSNNSVDAKEINYFSGVNDWWIAGGSMSALRAYNMYRIEYIRQMLKQKNQNIAKPFENINFLDVGCGGGLLCESLTRLGGNVTGIDATLNSIRIARLHASQDQSLEANLAYHHKTAEDLLKEDAKFDVVCSMEVIEHVLNQKEFVKTISKLTKPGGTVFLSTIDKTWASYLKVVLAAEYFIQMVPKGTHDWSKFLKPESLKEYCDESGLKLVNIQGVSYNLWRNEWLPTENIDSNYILTCYKPLI